MTRLRYPNFIFVPFFVCLVMRLLLLLLATCSYAVWRRHGLAAEAVFAESPECTTYIAESTIPGAGLGFFTAIELQPEDIIGPGDVMIPLTDQTYHLRGLGMDMIQRDDWAYIDPTADYLWNGVGLGMHRETAHPNDGEHEFVAGYAPGMDAVINCHLALTNVDKNYPRYDFVGLHRSRDPGVGAFTPYHGCETYATERVPIGGEIFKDYGYHWFTSRESVFGIIPLSDDYDAAEELVQSLYALLLRRNVTDTAIRRDLWALTTNLPWMKTSRTLKAIPSSYDTLELVAKSGIRAAYQPHATRSIPELQRTGRCADSIRPQPSTIRQAGRGAFTTRSFQSGSIVAGTPVLFFPTDDTLRMYDGNWWTKALDEQTDTISSYQLLYNYCYHHAGNISSIFLCPYGSGINYINHNRSRANVRLQWAPHGEMRHDETVLQRHPSSLYYTAAPRLWMDVVATRDIGTNEELFLDYGEEWEQAWTAHVQQWNADDDNSYPHEYMSAHDWNVRHSRAPLRTMDEEEMNPSPDNFVLTCLPHIADEDLMEDEDDISTSDGAEQLWNPSIVGIPCRILERTEPEDEDDDDDEARYWVEYHELDYPVPLSLDDEEYDIEWQQAEESIVRGAMRFQEAPYTSNLLLDNVFRQPIGFPNDIFPDAWRDVFLSPLPLQTA